MYIDVVDIGWFIVDCVVAVIWLIDGYFDSLYEGFNVKKLGVIFCEYVDNSYC